MSGHCDRKVANKAMLVQHKDHVHIPRIIRKLIKNRVGSRQNSFNNDRPLLAVDDVGMGGLMRISLESQFRHRNTPLPGPNIQYIHHIRQAK